MTHHTRFPNYIPITMIPSNYTPTFSSYMGIDQTQFVFDQIRNDVLVRNESRDIFIAQRRGAGKSTIAVRIATLLDPNFTLDHVCFTVSKFVSLITSRLEPGTVIIFDDLGTQKGGSSRKWQKQESQDLADIMQLNRTDRIITIATSLELDRGEKRMRAGFSLMIDPGDKLSDEDTGGRGLANQIKLRQKVVDVFGGSVRWQYWRYKAGGRIVGINISHPSAQVWVKGYLTMREQCLQDVKENRKDEIDSELTPNGTHKNAVDLAKMLGTQGKFIPSYRASLTQMHNQKAVSKESGIS